MKRIFIFSTLIIIVFTGCEKEQGCTNISSCNFSPSAEEDNGTCYGPGDSCDDDNSNTINDIYTSNCNCEGEPIDNGCTDEMACNYNASANTDDGSCLYEGQSCDDENQITYDDFIQTDCSCVGYGCNDSSACNFINLIAIDDGSCIYTGQSCDDGNNSTSYDVLNENCECQGLINDRCNLETIDGISNRILITLEYLTDANPTVSSVTISKNNSTIFNSFDWGDNDNGTIPIYLFPETLYEWGIIVDPNNEEIINSTVDNIFLLLTDYTTTGNSNPGNGFMGGYYSIKCIAESGHEIILIPETFPNSPLILPGQLNINEPFVIEF